MDLPIVKLQEFRKGKNTSYLLTIPRTLIAVKRWNKGQRLSVGLNKAGDIVITEATTEQEVTS